MQEAIIIHSEYTAMKEQNGHIPQGILSHSIEMDDGCKIEINIDLNSCRILVDANSYRISKKLKSVLNQHKKLIEQNQKESEKSNHKDWNKVYDSIDEDTMTELEYLLKTIRDYPNRILSNLKYFYCSYKISPTLFSVKNEGWSDDGLAWSPFPGKLFATIDGYSRPNLSTIGKALIKTTESQIRPFIGHQYLHRAKNESVPEYKWIDATIAAELCVKEALLRKEPKLKELLVNLPSPPLDKLYGKVLEHYFGERSPSLKHIREGVILRNKLIHTPQNEKVDGQKAIDYVEHVERAIFHLLALLYPNDPSIKYSSRAAN